MKTHPSYLLISLLQWLTVKTKRFYSIITLIILAFFILGFYSAIWFIPKKTLLSSSQQANQQHNKPQVFSPNPKWQKDVDYRENLNYPKTDWRAYSTYDLYNNPEVAVLNSGRRASWGDPNIWVYTKAFAERFGMPKRWIGGEDFTGALALVYRFELQDTGCDWNPCNPWVISGDRTRQYLDIYLPHDHPNIPWNTTDNVGMSYSLSFYNSVRYLTHSSAIAVRNKEGKLRRAYNGEHGQRDLEYRKKWYDGFRRSIGISHIYWATNFDTVTGYGDGGAVNIYYFQRKLFEDIDLITLGGSGLTSFDTGGEADTLIWLDGEGLGTEKEILAHNKIKEYNKVNFKRGEGPHKNMRAAYTITAGEDFMRRVREAYKKRYKSKKPLYKYLKDRYLQKKQASK